MSEMTNNININEIEALRELITTVENSYVDLPWQPYLPANCFMMTNVIVSYLANIDSPEDLLRASKATLYDLVEAQFIEYVSEFDEPDRSHCMKTILQIKN